MLTLLAVARLMVVPGATVASIALPLAERALHVTGESSVPRKWPPSAPRRLGVLLMRSVVLKRIVVYVLAKDLGSFGFRGRSGGSQSPGSSTKLGSSAEKLGSPGWRANAFR